MLNWLQKILGKDEKNGKAEVDKKSSNGVSSSVMKSNPLEGLGKLRFGRYSDNNKVLAKAKQWYAAEDLYKEKKYFESFEALFDYLRDEAEDNFHYTKTDSGYKFDLVQGSRRIDGEINDKFVSARAALAVMDNPSTAAMRRLLELNYTLYYNRTAINEDSTLYIVFDSEITSASPNKLYYGLRELAVKADRQDDLLLADFTALKAADTSHIETLSEKELEIKYRYFCKWIEEALAKAEKLNSDSFSGAIAYLLLGTVYRIDFLITPESKLLSDLERIHGMYWEKKEEIPLVERNQMMREALKKLQETTKEAFAASVFHAKGTFSMSSPSKTEKVKDHIYNANKDSRWYMDNKYPEIALRINEYGVLHNQFIYSMAKVQADITLVFMAVMHPDYFEELGLKQKFYDPAKREFNKEAIQLAIDNALAPYRDKYTSLKWDHKRISYDSRYDFGVTLSEYMANLNLETKRL